MNILPEEKDILDEQAKHIGMETEDALFWDLGYDKQGTGLVFKTTDNGELKKIVDHTKRITEEFVKQVYGGEAGVEKILSVVSQPECKNCGYLARFNDQFCRHCGLKLEPKRYIDIENRKIMN